MEDSFKEQEKLNTVAYPENPNIKQRFLQSKTKKILSIIDSVKNEFILKSTSSDDRLTIMGTALFFRKSMEDYHNEMKSYFIGSDSLIEESFGFKDIQQGNKVIPWEEAYLLKSPLAGIVTLLSKIKTDIILLEKSLFEEYT